MMYGMANYIKWQLRLPIPLTNNTKKKKDILRPCQVWSSSSLSSYILNQAYKVRTEGTRVARLQ